MINMKEINSTSAQCMDIQPKNINSKKVFCLLFSLSVTGQEMEQTTGFIETSIMLEFFTKDIENLSKK